MSPCSGFQFLLNSDVPADATKVTPLGLLNRCRWVQLCRKVRNLQFTLPLRSIHLTHNSGFSVSVSLNVYFEEKAVRAKKRAQEGILCVGRIPCVSRSHRSGLADKEAGDRAGWCLLLQCLQFFERRWLCAVCLWPLPCSPLQQSRVRRGLSIVALFEVINFHI